MQLSDATGILEGGILPNLLPMRSRQGGRCKQTIRGPGRKGMELGEDYSTGAQPSKDGDAERRRVHS